MRHIESQLQKNCVKWFRLQYRQIALLFFAVPNGGGRSKIEAGIMKAEGVTAGVADTILLYPSGPYNCLCVEFKAPGRYQERRQKDWQAVVEANGGKYVVCRSFEEFQVEIKGYLGF